MKIKLKKLLALAAILTTSASFNEVSSLAKSTDKHIFFDVGQVLIKPNKIKMIWQIGPKKLIRYCLKHGKLPTAKSLQKRLVEYIEYCSPYPQHAQITSCGVKLPGVAYRWITGQISSTELIQFLTEHPCKDHFFTSKAERDLILAMVDLFDPHTYVTSLQPESAMVKLLHECLRKYPNQVYIMSNWDESCELLEKQFPQIFQTVPYDHIIFSHKVGCAKPEISIFDVASKKFNLEPSQCILIDDHLENIRGFQEWGGHGILHTNPKLTKRSLHRLLKSI